MDVKTTSENENSKAILVTFYWDKTAKDLRAKHMMHCVYVGISSMDPRGRMKWSSKRLIGFLPICDVNVLHIPDNVTASAFHKQNQVFKRRLYQLALKIMFEPICYHQHRGFPLKKLGGEVINAVPRVIHCSGDIPEGKFFVCITSFFITYICMTYVNVCIPYVNLCIPYVNLCNPYVSHMYQLI